MMGSVPTDTWTSRITEQLASARATASMKRAKSTWLPPAPPRSPGVRIPAKPAAPAAPTTSRGDGPWPRAMAAAMGSMASRTKVSMRRAISPPPAASVDTDEGRLSLRDAAADAGSAIASTTAPKLVQQRHEDASTAGADGMSDRQRAAVDVHARRIHLQHARARDRHRRERLVDLDE